MPLYLGSGEYHRGHEDRRILGKIGVSLQVLGFVSMLAGAVRQTDNWHSPNNFDNTMARVEVEIADNQITPPQAFDQLDDAHTHEEIDLSLSLGGSLSFLTGAAIWIRNRNRQ